MQKRIDKVAVLGAGTMGARISAHLANAGVPSYLFDIVPPDADGPARNKFAASGKEAAVKSRPAAFMKPSLDCLVTIGNFEDDLQKLSEVDWIIEAVIEDLDLKRELLRKVDSVRKPGTIITTNTSGLPVAKIAEGFSEDFRRCWFGTHFFNPPRYMRLLEIIPTPDADPAAMKTIADFCDLHLGKSVVQAKDTPNFIANRIGTFSMLNVMRVMQEMDLSVEEVDALTGSAVGWPKTGTFRLGDMVGLDILGHVVRNGAINIKDERSDLTLPPYFLEMLNRKWLGDKTKGGFYKKQKGPEGEQRFVFDWKTIEYRPLQKAKCPALEMAKNVDELPERLKMLLAPSKDKVNLFLWSVLSDLWTYAANRVPEISDSIVEIDKAMKTGFNWEMGPFELWDAAGVAQTVERTKKEGKPDAANVEKFLASGKTSWDADDPKVASGRKNFDVATGDYVAEVVPAGVWSVTVAKKANGVVKKNAGASLIDIGDGVGCIEFHSKMNALGGDIVSLITQTMKGGAGSENFDAYVITNDAGNFSVGANIMMLLMAAQEQEWDEVDMAIRQFQNMTQAIKFSPKPVVVAPFGMTLGGGTEITLHGAARQAHAELYAGLVEVGVGLVPGGGGCKEMTIRAVHKATHIRPQGRGESVELMEAMKQAFEIVALAKVSTSALEAKGLGILSPGDNISMNRERVLCDAKERALELVHEGYRPLSMRSDIPAPGESILATLKMGIHIMRGGEFITDHEVKIATKVAHVLCGGEVNPGTLVSEQYLLDLEREAFISLAGEKKTQERIQFTLKTGKTLRN